MTADAELDEMERQLNERFRVQAIARHRRVQEWLQSRPVVVKVRKLSSVGPYGGWWDVELDDEGEHYRDHAQAVRVADAWARNRLALTKGYSPWTDPCACCRDTEEPPDA